MGISLRTNIDSMTATRYLERSQFRQKHDIESLSSGDRINRAADDAAGLSISEKLRATSRTSLQNVRNTYDALSLLQVAEGGLTEISNILVRFRELAIQS